MTSFEIFQLYDVIFALDVAIYNIHLKITLCIQRDVMCCVILSPSYMIDRAYFCICCFHPLIDAYFKPMCRDAF